MQKQYVVAAALLSVLAFACAAQPASDQLLGGADENGGAEDRTAAPTTTEKPDPNATIAYKGAADITESRGGGEGFAQPVPYKLSAGLFHVGGGISYSNGNDAYCTFASYPDYVEATWGNPPDINSLPEFVSGPVGMRFDGACGINFRPGFFQFGFTFYSNGSAYCACDHAPPPGARPTHRRPDSRFDGSCGGC